MLTSRDCFLPGKHLCWSPFLILSISKFLRAPFLKNICERLLLKRCSRKWETLKFIIRSFNFTLKTGFFNINIREVHDWFPMKFILTHNISLNKRRSKVQEKNMTCERAFTFDQWEFDYGLFTKFFENYCRSRLFSEFIQTQKRYPTSLDKIRQNLNLKTTCHTVLRFFLRTKLLEKLLHAKYLISVAAPLSITNFIINLYPLLLLFKPNRSWSKISSWIVFNFLFRFQFLLFQHFVFERDLWWK